MSKNDKEPDDLDRELDELNKEMEKEDEENRQAEQEEPQQESIENIEKRLRLENALHRRRLFNKMETALDISESERDSSGIPLSNLPSELQSQFKNRVNEAVNNQLTEIDSQMKAIQSQLEADLKKRAQEAQKKIDEKLQRALKLIDEHLTTGENTSFIKQFAQILAVMENEPLKNVNWIIRLFVTEDGIRVIWENATEAKK